MKLEQLCSDLVMIPNAHKQNLIELLNALNPIEVAYFEETKEWWKPTSGYRFIGEHVRIYNERNAKRKLEKKKPLATPLGSKHLVGLAVDIFDPEQKVKLFVSKHEDLFVKAGIYFEAFNYTPDWVHMQKAAPRSQKRYYIPF